MSNRNLRLICLGTVLVLASPLASSESADKACDVDGDPCCPVEKSQNTLKTDLCDVSWCFGPDGCGMDPNEDILIRV